MGKNKYESCGNRKHKRKAEMLNPDPRVLHKTTSPLSKEIQKQRPGKPRRQSQYLMLGSQIISTYRGHNILKYKVQIRCYQIANIPLCYQTIPYHTIPYIPCHTIHTRRQHSITLGSHLFSRRQGYIKMGNGLGSKQG